MSVQGGEGRGRGQRLSGEELRDKGFRAYVAVEMTFVLIPQYSHSHLVLNR